MNIPEKTRFVGDEDPMHIWWQIGDDLIDFTSGYTFEAKLALSETPEVVAFTKTTGFTGAAGTGIPGNGTPNLVVGFATTGELNDVDPGSYIFEIVATLTADGSESTLQMNLTMKTRLGSSV